MKESVTNSDIESVIQKTGYTPSNQTSDYSGVKAAYAWLSAQKKTKNHNFIDLKSRIRAWGLCYLTNDDIAIAATMLGILNKRRYEQESHILLSISKRLTEPTIDPRDVIPDYGIHPGYER